MVQVTTRIYDNDEVLSLYSLLGWGAQVPIIISWHRFYQQPLTGIIYHSLTAEYGAVRGLSQN